MTPRAADFLDAAVVSGLNVLVYGATQDGNPVIRQYTVRLRPVRF